MNTQENNKMIAEFMGYPHMRDAVDDRTIAYDIGGSIMNINNTHNQNEDDFFHPDDMKFHTSWDWLMPVVNKIEDYLSDKFGEVGYFDECLSSNDLEVRYQAVVEFINQYNKNKKK